MGCTSTAFGTKMNQVIDMYASDDEINVQHELDESEYSVNQFCGILSNQLILFSKQVAKQEEEEALEESKRKEAIARMKERGIDIDDIEYIRINVKDGNRKSGRSSHNTLSPRKSDFGTNEEFIK